MEGMQIQIIPLIIVVAYLVGMLVVGFFVSKLKIKNSKDYLVAGRRMGLFMVAFSLSANNIGGGCTTGVAQKAFGNWGLSACWYVLACSIAMIPLAYFAPKIRKTLAITIPEVVGRRFGKLSSNFTAILSVFSLFCLTSSQILASGSVISALIPSIPLNVCLIFAGIVIILYTTLGGMIADQISDLVQFLIILVGLAIATPIVLKSAGGWSAIAAKLPGEKLNFTQIGWASIIGYIFQYICTFLVGPEMVTRFETAKDEKTARNASFLSAVLMAAMSIFPTLLGLAAFALKDQIPGLAENGSNAMMMVTGHYAPGFITGLISAAIICATMSSADSNLLCMSTMIINDLYKGFGGKKQLSEKQIIFWTRFSNVIGALVAMAIQLLGIAGSIIALNTFAFGIRCAGPFSAYALGLVVPKATKNSGLFSIITGTIGFVVWQLLPSVNTYLMPVVFGSLISVVTFFVVNWIEWGRGVAPAPSAYLSDEEAAAVIAAEQQDM
ncbi:MAG: sodium:solute symporter family protein [Clostridia bacterium]|nr:sodium:solute symporter family protein [Clostridia bacterium]